jgi:hypothetical protein
MVCLWYLLLTVLMDREEKNLEFSQKQRLPGKGVYERRGKGKGTAWNYNKHR